MSLATSQTIQFSDLRAYAFTREKVFADNIDHVYSHSPSGAILFGETLGDQFGGASMKGTGLMEETGGIEIHGNVRLGTHAGSKAMAGAWDTHSTSPDDNTRRIIQNWKHYSGALVVSEMDKAVNAGDAAMGSFIEDQTESVMLSLFDRILSDAWSSTQVANGITPLNVLIGANSLAQGLSGADYDAYNSRGVTARGTAAASITFAGGSWAAQGISMLRRMWNNASEGIITPQFGITDYATHERYEGSLQPQERYTAPAEKGDAGFMALAFRRKPIFADPKCLANSLFALRVGRRDLSTRVLRPFSFRFAPFKPGANQETFVSELQWKGNFLLRNRRYGCNKMNAITD